MGVSEPEEICELAGGGFLDDCEGWGDLEDVELRLLVVVFEKDGKKWADICVQNGKNEF